MKEGIPSTVHQVQDGEALVTGQVRGGAGGARRRQMHLLPSLSPELNPQTHTAEEAWLPTVSSGLHSQARTHVHMRTRIHPRNTQYTHKCTHV